MKLRTVLKRAVKWLFLILALPLFGLFVITCTLVQSNNSFSSFSQLISLLPGKAGIYLRAAFYRLTSPETSDEISVGFLTILSHRNTSIDRGVYIGPQCNIGMCRIGENTLIGSGVHILSGNRQHEFKDIESPIQEQGGRFEKIEIGEDCWIGNNAIIMTNLAPKTIVAAGSVVTKESSQGDIIGGNPARLIKNRYVTCANNSTFEVAKHEK